MHMRSSRSHTSPNPKHRASKRRDATPVHRPSAGYARRCDVASSASQLHGGVGFAAVLLFFLALVGWLPTVGGVWRLWLGLLLSLTSTVASGPSATSEPTHIPRLRHSSDGQPIGPQSSFTAQASRWKQPSAKSTAMLRLLASPMCGPYSGAAAAAVSPRHARQAHAQ